MPGSEHGLLGLVRFALYLMATIGLSSLSYYGFERYFLRLKKSGPAATLTHPPTDAPVADPL